MSSEAQVKRILILTANPKGTDKLRLDEEARDIVEGLRRAKERDRFEIHSQWAVRPRDIRRALLDFKPHIVHFSGHGAADAGLAFENELGQIHLVPSEALAGLFKLFTTHVECVLLNACYSEIQATAIVEHINFVIGMNQAIGDKAAIEFSIGFYDALMAGCSVEMAYEFGCNAIQLAGVQEHLTPVIKKKNSYIPTDESNNACQPSSNENFSVTRTVALQSPPKTIYEFVVSGNIDESDKQRLEAIVAHLQQVTGDVNLTLLRVEKGSVKLIFEGSPEGFRQLKALMESGQLTEVLDSEVQSLASLNPKTPIISVTTKEKYWSLVQMTSAGGVRIRYLAVSSHYLNQHFPNETDYDRLQSQLVQRYQSGDQIAGLCLRCFISHIILQTCQSIVNQFGTSYSFKLSDFLAYVLNDDGKLDQVPFSVRILQTFSPERSSLTAWTSQFVRNDREVNRFLIERGLYRLSDWAILNDTRPRMLERILREIYQLTDLEVMQSSRVLESYREICLYDGIAYAAGEIRRSVTPTYEQLQRIAQKLVTLRVFASISPEAVLIRLQQLATKLRQYRLASRGAMTALPSDDSVVFQQADQLVNIQNPKEEEDEVEQFLQAYQTSFVQCLDEAIARVVQDRMTQLKTENRRILFLSALRLHFCQHCSMTMIARELGLTDQATVSHLLNLQQLRINVRSQLLSSLKPEVRRIAQEYSTPEQLQQLDAILDDVLLEQIDRMEVNAAIKTRASRSDRQHDLLATRLCFYLDQL